MCFEHKIETYQRKLFKIPWLFFNYFFFYFFEAV